MEEELSFASLSLQVPVSQIVPLPDVHSVLCVALGGWEIAQIR